MISSKKKTEVEQYPLQTGLIENNVHSVLFEQSKN